MSVARVNGEERMFFYGLGPDGDTPILASSDLDSFVLTEIGDIVPTPPEEDFPVNLSADHVGHLVAYSPGGFVQQIDQTSGAVLQAFTGAGEATTWANIATPSGDVFLFADINVVDVDLATEQAIKTYSTTVAPIGAAEVVTCR